MARTHASVYMPRVRELKDHGERLTEVWALFLDTVGLNNDCPVMFMYRHNERDVRVTCDSCLQDRPKTFAAIVNNAVEVEEGDFNECVFCVICRKPEWRDNTDSDVDGNIVCDDCRSSYSHCRQCEDWSINQHYLTTVMDYGYCESCRDVHCSYCDDCNEWYHDDYSDDHDHERHVECECTPHDLRFKILANSHGVMQQDERLLVELPEGHITQQAVNAAIQLIWSEQFEPVYQQWMNLAWKVGVGYDYNIPKPEGYVEYSDLDRVVRSLEPVWQAKRGNYTRRLSAAFYKELGAKLQEGLLSKVGATIRAHTTMQNSWHIELTRDLNQSARAFYHEDSCWWGSESDSLCALKHWGGLGMRSYDSDDQDRHFPSGRAWVQPLNEDMEPTLDVFGAHAYVVYNGYGGLSGYTGARILAYLTSKTYKKIEFDAAHQYVNCENFLIADQEVCNNTTSVSIDRNYHEAVSA